MSGTQGMFTWKQISGLKAQSAKKMRHLDMLLEDCDLTRLIQKETSFLIGGSWFMLKGHPCTYIYSECDFLLG